MGNCLVPLTLRSWRVRCGIGPMINSTRLMIHQMPMPHLYSGSFLGSMIRRNFTIYRGVQLDCAIAMGLAPLSSWCGWPISTLICGIAAITFAVQRTWRMLLARLSSSCRAVRSYTSILVLRSQFGRLRTSKSFVRSLSFRCDKVSEPLLSHADFQGCTRGPISTSTARHNKSMRTISGYQNC